MANKLILLKDPLVPGDTFYPVTMASGVICQGTNQEYTLQALVNQIESYNGGGGGGGSTVTGNSITLSTSAQTFMTIDGSTSYTIKLPPTDPWAGNYAASSHAHGDITSSGQITAGAVSAASGQSLVVVSNNSIKKSAITLGSSTTQFLANNGTWVQPSIANISGFPSFSSSNSGQVLKVQDNGTLAWGSDNTGGGGGGDTVTGKTVTLSTAGQAVIQVNGSNSGSVLLPSTITVGGTNMPEIAIGTETTTQQVPIASGDRLVITDNSASNKLRATSISFGSSTSTFLRNDGQWATPAGGGGGTTVTLPSGYSASTGITLSSSAPTTIATVGGTELKLKAPAGSGTTYYGGRAIYINRIDAINANIPVAGAEAAAPALIPNIKDYILPVFSLESGGGTPIYCQQNTVIDPINPSRFPDDQTVFGEGVTMPEKSMVVFLPEFFSVLLTLAEQMGVRVGDVAVAIMDAANDYIQ